MTAAMFHAVQPHALQEPAVLRRGAVLNATGERNLARLGGLIHRMPTTAPLVLIGAVAISALPPLNGFVSEWLPFQAILVIPILPELGHEDHAPGRRCPVGAVRRTCRRVFRQGVRRDLLGPPALAGGRTARARSTASRSPRWSSLAALCLLAGVLPGAGRSTRWRRSSALLVGGRMPRADRRSPGCRSRRSPRAAAPTTACWCSCSSSSPARWRPSSIHRLASDAMRRAPAWDCGFPDPSPATQYTADELRRSRSAACSAPSCFAPASASRCRAPGDMRAGAHSSRRLHDLVWETFYRADRRRSSAARRRGSTACSSSPSANT